MNRYKVKKISGSDSFENESFTIIGYNLEEACYNALRHLGYDIEENCPACNNTGIQSGFIREYCYCEAGVNRRLDDMNNREE